MHFILCAQVVQDILLLVEQGVGVLLVGLGGLGLCLLGELIVAIVF